MLCHLAQSGSWVVKAGIDCWRMVSGTQAVASVPELLASIDASCSVILHHLEHVPKEAEPSSPTVLPVSTEALGRVASSGS